METIPPAELFKLLTTVPGLALLDVRTPAEFAEVHVPQARNIPLDVLAPDALLAGAGFTREQPVYLLCRSGFRAQRAAERLDAGGFLKPIVVEGGTAAWSRAGLPVERGPSQVISLERQVRIAAGSLVLIGLLLAYFVHPWFIGLSAFVGAGLVFAGITDFCGMGLLLARLPWNR